MLKVEKIVTPSPEQWEIIIEGMRNPKNSWDRMDSYTTYIEDPETLETASYEFFMGDKDLELAENLAGGGPVHGKFRRMIPVYMTINAPLYWWKEFDTYKIGTVCNSCSTMHKIHAKEFAIEDFSWDHIMGGYGEDVPFLADPNDPQNAFTPENICALTVNMLNACRLKYLEAKTKPMKEEAKRAGLVKDYWWQMIQLLPSSYNQKRTIMLNYEVLANIYRWRKDHKLDEWKTLCKEIEKLPYSELITGEKV